MDNCKHCGTDLIHVPGRKKKDFCNVNCRNKWFYAERKRFLAEALKSMVQLPSDYVNVKKVGILTKEGEVKPLTFSKPKSGKKKPLPDLSGNIEFKEPTKDAYDSPKKEILNDEPLSDWEIQLQQFKTKK